MSINIIGPRRITAKALCSLLYIDENAKIVDTYLSS